jgi:acetolactate synthase I/II/III large subunit
MISAGHALARLLQREHVPWVTGVAGESFLPLLDGMREERLPFLQTVHEAGATFLATAYARASGSPAVVAVTRGPGASNALIGVHEAWEANASIVLLVGQIETSMRGRSVLQEMDICDVFRSTVKEVHEVTRPDRVVSSMAAALRQSRMGRPGPVVVSVPSDHFAAQIEESDLRSLPAGLSTAGVLSETQLRDLTDALSGASRALLIVGAAFANGRAATVLQQFVQTTGIALIGGHVFPDVVDPDVAQFLGASTVRSSTAISAALREADVVLALGHRLGDRVTQGYVSLSGRLIVIDAAPTVGWDEYLGVELLVADPVAVLLQLEARLRHTEPSKRSERIRWVAEKRSQLVSEAKSILEEERRAAAGVPFATVIDAVDCVLPDGSSVVSDAGTFNEWIVRFLPFRKGRTFHGTISGAMGFGVPAAIGVQLAKRDRRTIVFCGDGGFLMTGLELSTAVRLALPITVVVFNNGIWGTVALHQDATFPGNRYAVDLPPQVSFVALAKGMGAEAFLVSRIADLQEVLRHALHVTGPALVEVITDPRWPSPTNYGARPKEGQAAAPPAVP